MYLGNRFFTIRAGWDGFGSGYARYVTVELVVAFVLNKRWTFRSAAVATAQAISHADRILDLPLPERS